MAWLEIPPTIWIETESEALEMARYLRTKKELAFDTETTGLNTMTDYPVLFSFSDGIRRYAGWAEFLFLAEVRWLLESGEIIIIGTNIKFDMHMCANRGIFINGPIWDTLSMDFLFDENRQGRHGLKDAARDHCGIQMQDFKVIFPMMKKQKGRPDDTAGEAILRAMADPERKKKAINYSGLDAYATFKLKEFFHIELSQIFSVDEVDDNTSIYTMWDYFVNIESKFTKVLWLMERRGFTICKGYFQGIEIPMKKIIKETQMKLNAELSEKFGEPINLNSPAHLRRLFYEILGKTPTKWTTGGASGNKQPSTDKEVLTAWAEEGDPYAKAILEYSKLTTVYDTFVVGLQEYIDNNFKLHTSLNQHITVTGRLSSSGPNCFDAETEVLTKQGWLKFPLLNMNDEIAQWDNGIITFVKPENIIVKKNDKEMVAINNDHIDLLVTPDHRCLLKNRKNGKLEVFPAENYPEDKMQLHSGIYDNEKGNSNISDDELRLICAIQADGHYHDNGVDFAFKKLRKVQRLQDILNRAGYLYSYNVNKNGKHRIRILKSTKLKDLIDIYLGPDKGFDYWVFDLSRHQLDVLIEEIYHWDGLITKKNNYSSNNKKNADVIQAALVLSGKRVNLRKYQGAKNINYQLDITHRDYSLTTNVKKKNVYYDRPEFVYCVSVPSSYILIRRNGKVCVTGQCQNIPRPATDRFKIRDGFIASPGKRLIVFDYSQLEMLILAHKSNDPIMIEAIKNGKDLHCLAVSLIFAHPYEEVIQAKKDEKHGKQLTDKQKQLLLLRQAMKNVGYGIVYGIGAKKLAHDLTLEFQKTDKDRFVDEDEAQGYIDAWYNLFRGVKEFIAYEKAQVKKHARTRTFLRRLRRLPEINSGRFKDRIKAERQAINIIQGDASDILRIAMIVLEYHKRLKELNCEMILQVHDELIFEIDDDDLKAEEAMLIIKYEMEESFNNHIFKLRVPLSVEGGSGYSWKACK